MVRVFESGRLLTLDGLTGSAATKTGNQKTARQEPEKGRSGGSQGGRVLSGTIVPNYRDPRRRAAAWAELCSRHRIGLAQNDAAARLLQL